MGSSPTTKVSPEELLKTPDQARPGWLPGPPASHRGRLPAGHQPSLLASLFPAACGWGEVGAREGCGGRRGTRLAKGHDKQSVGAGKGWLLQHVSRHGLARPTSRVAPSHHPGTDCSRVSKLIGRGRAGSQTLGLPYLLITPIFRHTVQLWSGVCVLVVKYF